MLRRVIWFSIGAGVAIYAYVKLRDTLKQATPQAITDRVGASAAGLTDRAQDFADRVRAAMAEREVEIRASFEEPEPRHGLGPAD